jgi:hypothetical protein
VLAPALRARSGVVLVIMDNLAPHKAAAAREALDRAGLAHRCLPPYSPDLNPIELARSKPEEALRQTGPRTTDALGGAMPAALAAITPDGATARLRHCGHRSDQDAGPSRTAHPTRRGRPQRPTLSPALRSTVPSASANRAVALPGRAGLDWLASSGAHPVITSNLSVAGTDPSAASGIRAAASGTIARGGVRPSRASTAFPSPAARRSRSSPIGAR